MRNCKNGVCLLILLLSMQTVFSQTYKAGDKLEAFIGNTWKEVTVVKPVAGKTGIYEVQQSMPKTYRGPLKNTVTVSKGNLRMMPSMPAPVAVASANPTSEVVDEKNLYHGRYELYSGIPTMYIGHVILLGNGKYKAAFDSDDTNYEVGNYIFHPDTNTIEWVSGMFKNNNWGGKMVNKSGKSRIEFNRATFADSN